MYKLIRFFVGPVHQASPDSPHQELISGGGCQRTDQHAAGV